MRTTGLKFEKFDLHVHTPASFDFIDKNITAKDIVDHAINIGLRGIAITDHNTGEWIDKIKTEAKDKNFVIIPGVEIYCTGGEKGIHVIGLFDVDKDSNFITGVLGALLIDPSTIGKEKAVCSKSVGDVIDIISSPPYNGIAVLAHSTSSKGVLSDIKGETRTEIFKKKGLLAVETSKHDFENESKKTKKVRAIDLLNGDDVNYYYKKLGIYISSDSHEDGKEGHTLKGIGSEFTYFKVDENITLESLRQCFIDREVRIRQYFEYKPNKYPHIKSIQIKGGFFDEQTANFHVGLNSILGAKGAGKSLLIELLRFGLNRTSTQNEIKTDHNSKLAKKLNTYGSVIIKLVDETGVEHEIERIYNPSTNSQYKNSDHLSITNSFNVIFLSQNEIIKIAENEEEQIRFIDRFFDFQYYKNKITNIEKDLSLLDDKLSDSIKAFADFTEVQKQLTDLIQKKEKLEKLLSDNIYDSFRKIEEKNNYITEQERFISQFESDIAKFVTDIKNKPKPILKGDNQYDPLLKRNQDILQQIVSKTLKQIELGNDDLRDLKNKFELEKLEWNKKFNEEKKRYEEHIRNTGGDRKTQENNRLKLISEVDSLQNRLTILNKKKDDIKELIRERDEKISELFSVYTDYSQERKSKCQKFENESQGKLKITIYESTNYEEFKNSLLGLKKGSYIQSSEIITICEKINPKDFISKLFNYEVSKKTEQLETISKQSGITIDKIKILSDFLLSQVSYKKLFELQYKAKPQDKPEIKYKVNDADYELIKDISVGQKCTAMLIMTLSDGLFPVIIDQPEDSLDVRSIWEDMCLKIRKGKDNRQFIFTTHNSSLAVASDTDMFTIVESNLNTGKIVFSGAIDTKDVKEEVIKYLEGGRETYSQKATKYDMK